MWKMEMKLNTERSLETENPKRKKAQSPSERYFRLSIKVLIGITCAFALALITMYFVWTTPHTGWQKYFEVTNIHQEGERIYGEITNISNQKLYNVDLDLICTNEDGKKIRGTVLFYRYINGKLSSRADSKWEVDIDIGETVTFGHFIKEPYKKVVVRNVTFDKNP